VGVACGTCGTGVGGAKITTLSGEGLRVWMGVTRMGWGGGLAEGRDVRAGFCGGFALCRSTPTLWWEGVGLGFLCTCMDC
jgi:hypothetical protein